MAISNRTSTTVNSATAAVTTLTINKPTGTISGDVLIANVAQGGGSNSFFNPPIGWTLITSIDQTTTIGEGCFYRVAGASEPTTYTFTITTAERMSVVINAYSGVDNNNPIAGFITKNAATTTTPAHSALIPQAETCYGVILGASRNTTGTVTLTTASSGYTKNGDTCTTATPFVQAYLEDQHTTYTLPLATVTPGTDTISVSGTYANTTVFLRPDISTVTTLVTDVATFIPGGGPTILTPNFNTGYANEYIVVFAQSDGAGAFSASTTVTSNNGLTWHNEARANSASTTAGCAEVWWALATTKLSALNITITGVTSSVVWGQIASFVNSSGIGATNTSSVNPGTPSLALTTTAANSWVWGTVFDTSNKTAATAGTAQTMFYDDISVAGESGWTQRQTATTTSSGTSVTINNTTPTAIGYNMALAEILMVTSGTLANGNFFMLM